MQYHLYDGQEWRGPFSYEEIADWIGTESQASDVIVWNGVQQMMVKELFPELFSTTSQNSPKDTPRVRIHEDSGAPEKQLTLSTELSQSLEPKRDIEKKIRDILNQLWDAHCELYLMSEITEKAVGKNHHETKASIKTLKNTLKHHIYDYKKAEGTIDKLIDDIVKYHSGVDLEFPLEEQGCIAKCDYALKWLVERNLADRVGCYCFKVIDKGEPRYLYIGLSGLAGQKLRGRLKDHERTVYFEKATHLRILIPHNKSRLEELERLLLIRYGITEYNQTYYSETRSKIDSLVEKIEERTDFFFKVNVAVRRKKKLPNGKIEGDKTLPFPTDGGDDDDTEPAAEA